MGERSAGDEGRDVQPILVAEKALHPEAITEVRDMLTRDGLFQRFIEQIAQLIQESEAITLQVEPDADDEPIDPEAQFAASAQAVRDICGRFLKPAADETFRTHVTRDALSHAAAWAMGDLTRSTPREQLLAMDEATFAEAYERTYASRDYLGQALETLLPAYMEMAAGAVVEAIGANADAPNLNDRFETAFHRALSNYTPPQYAPAPIASAFTPDAISFLNSPHTLAFIRGAWKAANGQTSAWQRTDYAPPYYADETGVHVYMQEGGQFNPTTRDLDWQRVLDLDDNKVSTFLICIGKWLADTGGQEKQITKTRVHVADILGFRGIQKHHKGGYRREHKEEARRDILALNSIWVRSRDTVYERPGKPKVIGVQSRLLEVAIESQADVFGVEEPYAFRIAPGEWAKGYLGRHNRWVALLLRPVMQYDPYRQRLPMRLGLYLFSQWRIRASYDNYEQTWAARTLIDGAQIPLPTESKNYSRFRDQFEAALDRLQADGALVDWDYQRDSDLPARGWWDQWLGWHVRITPPAAVIEQYQAFAPRREQAITRSKRARAAARRRSPP